MTKRLAMVLGLLLLAVVLVAASAQAGHKTQKVTNVTFAGWSSGPDEDALDQQMADKFNATHTGIHVTWTVINGDYGQAMTARFAAHNAPDVFYVDSERDRQLDQAGRHSPLNSMVKATTSRRSRSIRSCSPPSRRAARSTASRRTGRRSRRRSTTGCSSRQASRRRRRGQQLKSDAKAIKNEDLAKHPICLSADWARMGAFMYQNKGSITKHLTSQANVQAVKFYVGLLKSGLAYSPPSGSWCGQELGQGHAAIAFEGNWLLPYMKSTYPEHALLRAPNGQGQGAGEPRLHRLVVDCEEQPEQGGCLEGAQLARRQAG